MNKKLMGTLMVLGLVMAFALPAFASPNDSPSSGPEVTSADDTAEAAEEARDSSPETEAAEVEESGHDSSPDAPGAR